MANPTRSQMKEKLKELKEQEKLKELRRNRTGSMRKNLFNKIKEGRPAESIKAPVAGRDIPQAERNVAEDAMKLNKLIKEKGVGILGGKKKPDGSYDFKVNKKDGGSICGRPTGKGFGKARRRS